jgi:hypothetical protein
MIAAGRRSVGRPELRDVAVLYRVLADLVLIVHTAFVAFTILGALLAVRWRWIPWLHVPAVCWGAVVEFTGWVCPLTPLENSLRSAGGSAGYSGAFTEHYVVPILYSTTLTRNDQIEFGAALLLLNFAMYGFVLHRSRRSSLGAARDAAVE